MDIGTAKPDAAARARVPHHLIDVIDPTDAYSAARFRADAIAAIAGVRARGAVPLVVGGTMLYFKALRHGLSALPPADPAVRARLSARAAAEGWPALHADLARVDPQTAARLEATDAQRIQRALEVCEIAGRPLSELLGAREADGALGPSIAIALVPPDRAALHAKIARTVRRDGRRGPRRGARGIARALRAHARPSVDALRRLSAGVGASRRARRRRDVSGARHRGDAAARQAPAHVAPRDACHGVRSDDAAARRRDFRVPGARRACGPPDSALLLCNNPRFTLSPPGRSGRVLLPWKHARCTTSSGTATWFAPKRTARRSCTSIGTSSTRSRARRRSKG